MCRSITTLVIAVCAGVASAATNCKQQPATGDPSGNPVYHPGLDEQVPVGAPFDITWNHTTTGTVSIVLLRGDSQHAEPYQCLVENLANTGTYSWTPDKTLQNDETHWGLRIMVDGSGQYQYSTQFGIRNPESSSSVTTKTAKSTNVVSTEHHYHTKYQTGEPPKTTGKVYNHTVSETCHHCNHSTTHTKTLPTIVSVYESATSASASDSGSTILIGSTSAAPLASVSAVVASGGGFSPNTSGPVGSAPTAVVAAIPTKSKPATQPANGAGKVGAGGLIAGVGAIAAFVL